MVNKDLVTAKLDELSDKLEQIRKHRKQTVEQFEADRTARDLVSFNLMLAVQACTDIAGHIIADEGWPPAPTLAESFRRLKDKGVLSPPTASSLANAIGLRNVIAHGYSSIDRKMLHAASVAGLADLESFAREISTWLVAQ